MDFQKLVDRIGVRLALGISEKQGLLRSIPWTGLSLRTLLEVYGCLSDDSEIKGVVLIEGIAKAAGDFSFWKRLHQLTPDGDDLKHVALTGMRSTAQTFLEKLDVLNTFSLECYAGERILAEMSMIATKLSEWRLISQRADRESDLSQEAFEHICLLAGIAGEWSAISTTEGVDERVRAFAQQELLVLAELEKKCTEIHDSCCLEDGGVLRDLEFEALIEDFGRLIAAYYISQHESPLRKMLFERIHTRKDVRFSQWYELLRRARSGVLYDLAFERLSEFDSID